MTSKLYPFQKKGVQAIRRLKGRALVGDDMGLGKTIQSLFYCWMHLPADRPIVVLCPASLKEHWRREASKHVDMRADILEHRKPPAHFNTTRTNRVYIINPEILGSGYSSVKTWCKVLRQMKPAAVVIDEAHLYTNPTAKRTKNMFSLCAGVKTVIALTGTPTDDMPNKLFPIAHLLKPKIFPSYNHFCYRYCRVEQTPWGPKFVGTRRPKELHRLLKKHLMIRRKFEDVFSQLPKMTRTVVPLKLPPKAMKEYLHAENDFIRWLRKKYPKGRKATRAERAERMVKFGYLMRLVAELKRPLVEDWIRNFLQATRFKLVVFGVHKSMIRHGLHPKFKGSYLIDGGVHPTRRQEVVDRFVAARTNAAPLFGNLKAAGTGWSAKGVPFVAVAEFGLNPADLKQAERRVQGIGRGVKNMASVAYYLPVRGTIEEKILKIVQTKQKNADAVLDGKTTRGLEVADLLQQELLKKGGLL